MYLQKVFIAMACWLLVGIGVHAQTSADVPGPETEFVMQLKVKFWLMV